MKKAMKQLFQKGISGLLCAAMILTSLSIPEMTAYASQTELDEEADTTAETADETDGEAVNVTTDGSDTQDPASVDAEGNDGDTDTGAEDPDSKDANSQGGGGGSADELDTTSDGDDTVVEPDEPVNDVNETDSDDNGVSPQLESRGAEDGIDFYYYYPDTEDTKYELGIYLYKEGTADISTEVTGSNWTVSDGTWNWDETIYPMEAVEDYSGWYKIKLMISDVNDESEADYASFKIYYRVADSEDAVANVDIACSGYGTTGDNQEIYNALLAEGLTSYAVKDEMGYANPVKDNDDGNDYNRLNAIEKSVTLHVYSDKGTPALMLSSSLSVLEEEEDETSESTEIKLNLSELEASYIDSDENKYYKMVEDEDYWYSLTFVVPDTDASEKICELYVENTTGEYDWDMNFLNGPVSSGQEAWDVDFTPVFNGETYYKDGEFYESAELAEDGDGDGDSITFYYYNAGVDEGDELGLVFWDTDDSYSSADTYEDWSAWEGADTYKVQPVSGYPGWYSVPITFVSGGSSPGYAIYKHSASSETGKIDQFQVEEDDNYPQVSDDTTAFAYKDGKYYYGKDDVDIVMRNVTFYVYNEVGTPALCLGYDSLSYVDESGDIKSLNKSAIPDWDNEYFYDMNKDEQNNWYVLTFSVPVSTTKIGLYIKTVDDDNAATYKWSADFSSNDITNLFDGKIYYKNGLFSDSRSITLGMLKTLITEAEKITEQGDYTDETWNEFKTALNTAKSVESALTSEDDSYTDEDDDNTIAPAYNSLNTAMNNLAEKGKDITFIYYVGDTNGKEVAVYQWSNNNNISFDADVASWKAWGSDTVYEMEPTKYPGWYSIPITFRGNVTDNANFQIFTENDTSAPIFKCGSEVSNDNGDNSAIYNKLFAAEEDTYAVKAFGTTNKLYEGATEVNTAMRNVTLYVCSKDAAPAIGSGSKLSSINENTGEIAEITESSSDSNTYYYNMASVTDKEGWYELTFAAPVAIESSDVICGLYTVSGNTYTHVKTFVEGTPEDNNSVDFTPVFNGYVYYSDGVFYTSMIYAEGVTLGMLKALLDSGEVSTIVTNGENNYTSASWAAFTKAKEDAEAVVAECEEDNSTSQDDYKSNEITDAYITLDTAINSMEEAPAVVTFYYYNDSIAEDEELGLCFWTSNNSYSTAEKTDWNYWDTEANITYRMESVEGYPGWYSIPMVFVTETLSDSSVGFAIVKSTDRSSDVASYSKDSNYPDLDKAGTAYAVKNSKYYYGEELVNLLLRNVTLYVYSEDGEPVVGTINEISAYVDENSCSKVSVSYSDHDNDNYYYDMKEAEDDDNWYYLVFSAPAAAEDTKEIGTLYTKNDSSYDAVLKFIEGETTEDNAVDFTPYFGKTVYFKNGELYDSMPFTVDDLKKLIEEAETLKNEESDTDKPKYLHADDGGKWDAFLDKIISAQAVVDNEDRTDADIQTAYNDLKTAMKELVPVPQESKTISVESVAVADDFMMGADLSSYVSLKESGVVFKDENGNALSDEGFFKMLYEGGTNWVRIRIWNDPYDSNGNGYGGGNSDLDKAKIIGKLATDAGMRVLIDFHYSDFWADPSKQDAPKAWKNYSVDEKVDAVYDYTLESLQALRAAGVDVGMVQVGNETNNGICGVFEWSDMAKIFNAGSSAVKAFDENCLVALHFADPSSSAFPGYASKLDANNVNYDVFAASFYPFWHGTTENLTEVLQGIASTYNKKVMVVETSWVTSWEDGDGHDNTAPKTTQDLNYLVSVQGQADEMRDVVNAVNLINDRLADNPAIGVFYWEPAWISPYYVYNGDSIDQSLYNKNKEAWEKYGSGWASSYAAEYDPTDAGLWYGGSAVDNEAWFDFNGQALETAKIYSYIRTGAVVSGRENSIDNVESEIELKVNVGDIIEWPDENDIVVTFNDGKKNRDDDGNVVNPHGLSIIVDWDKDQKALVSTDKSGVYTVSGKALCTYLVNDDDTTKTKSETYNVTLTIEVLSTSNVLENGGFESGQSPWRITWLDGTNGTGAVDNTNNANPRSGDYGMHFWSSDTIHLTLEQTIENVEAGIYTAGGFIEGNGASSKDVQTLYVTVTDSNGVSTTYEQTCSLNGWLNWVNPEITNIKVSEGDTLAIGMEIKSSIGEAWGSIDDMYLYGQYGVDLSSDIEHGTVSVSNMEPDSGEVVRIAAMPENGYYLSKLTISGKKVESGSLKDSSGVGTPSENDEENTSSIIYENSDATMQAYFAMPVGMVTVYAEFTPIDFSTAVSFDKVEVADFNSDGVYNDTLEYTGKKIELDLELNYLAYKLTSADYTAKYADNTKVGQAKITISAKGKKFTGTKTLYFNIADTKVDISKAKAVLSEDDDPSKNDTYYYTGDEIEPSIMSLTDKNGAPLKDKEGNELKLDKDDYTIYYEKNIAVGKATMIVISNSNGKIKGTFTQTFTIAKRPITDSHITVSSIAGGVYTGSKITPNVTVKYDNKVLQNGKDYTVTYKNNVNVSTSATVKPSLKITGKGNYTGTTAEYNFEISAKSIGDYGMKVTAEAIAENKAPKITLKNGTKKLTLNKHYRITEITREADSENPEETIYKCDAETGAVSVGNKPTDKISKAGTYTVTLVGIEKGGYGGSNEVSFRVVDQAHLMSSAKIASITPQAYTGSEVKLTDGDSPALKVTAKDGTALVYNKDYTVSYTDDNGNKTNIKAGKATVTVTGKGEYAGTKTAKFTISKMPISSVDIRTEAKENTVLYKIEQKTQDGAIPELPYTGYTWMPELNVYGTIGSNPEKLLTNGVDYTISYKKNLKAGDTANVIIKGKGNYSGTVTLNDVFKVKDVTFDDFVITISPVEYTGKALKPNINFVYKETGTVVNLKSGTAFTAKYANNKDVASIESSTKPTVTITEKGLNANKKGTAKNTETLNFTITTGRLTAACVSDVKVQTYSGKPVTPALTIKVNGKKLKAGTDYVVTYTGNSRPNAKATAQIIGIGNYSGTVNKTFVIK